MHGFARKDRRRILEEDFTFVEFFTHAVDGYPDRCFTMIHLPKGWHHPFVERERSVVDIERSHSGQAQQRCFQNEWAGN